MAARAAGCTLTFVLLDVTVTTVLYSHGSHLSAVREDVENFSVLCSVGDLWAAALLRSALLLGACIGVWWNREDGPRRVAKATAAVALLCLLVLSYAVAKLLMLTELRPLHQQPWRLGLLGWTFASSLGLLLPWRLLGNVAKATRGESPAEGRRPEEEPTSGATLGRLLAYSRKDAGLLSVAVLFLLVSAVCE